MNIFAKLRQLLKDKTYEPEYDMATKTYEYPNCTDTNYVECPKCKGRIFSKKAISLVKCNKCGYQIPKVEKKLSKKAKKNMKRRQALR